jgi:hypothetical protein
LRLQHVHRSEPDRTPSVYKFELDDTPAVTLSVDEAIEELSVAGSRFVFFAHPESERGRLLYRRYDGHYGLITLE